jgi:CubicO group peptidase (beta-lactamase class C family)
MRNLVCACTGVPRRDLELIFNAGSLTAEDVVKSLRTFQFFTKFGEAWQYSNQMVGTGGYLAGVAGGARPDDLYNGYLAQMQQRVFDPIGMPSTTFSFDRVAATPDHAVPHGLNLLHEVHPIPLSTEELLRPIAPAGASWSNASDMARYLITELNQGLSPDGVRVVSSENLKVTWQPQVAVDANSSYGLGWFVEKYKGLQLLEHGGNTLGFTSDLAFLPQADLGIVVLANAQGSNIFNQAVRNRLFELAYGLPVEHDARFAYALDAQRKAVQDVKTELGQGFDAGAVAPYLGAFTNEALGDITLSIKDGKLTLDAGEFTGELRVHVDESGKISYVFFDGPLASLPFEFKQDGAGKPIIVLVQPPDTYEFTRKE